MNLNNISAWCIRNPVVPIVLFIGLMLAGMVAFSQMKVQNDPDIVALVGASAALTISGIPFMGPISAARVAYINNEYVINPMKSENSGRLKYPLGCVHGI